MVYSVSSSDAYFSSDSRFSLAIQVLGWYCLPCTHSMLLTAESWVHGACRYGMDSQSVRSVLSSPIGLHSSSCFDQALLVPYTACELTIPAIGASLCITDIYTSWMLYYDASSPHFPLYLVQIDLILILLCIYIILSIIYCSTVQDSWLA